MVAPGLFVHYVRDYGQGPELPPVGVSAELEIDAGLLGFFQVERLVVKEDGEASVSIWKE